MPHPTSLRFRVTGRVQHVWFRGWAQQTARNLGLAGWVRNEPDGSVRGVAQGSTEALERFRLALYEGPPSALVGTVEAELETQEGDSEIFADFVVRR